MKFSSVCIVLSSIIKYNQANSLAELLWLLKLHQHLQLMQKRGGLLWA
ncbi:hypothetical protein [Calothrix sp. NIES-2098]